MSLLVGVGGPVRSCAGLDVRGRPWARSCVLSYIGKFGEKGDVTEGVALDGAVVVQL